MRHGFPSGVDADGQSQRTRRGDAQAARFGSPHHRCRQTSAFWGLRPPACESLRSIREVESSRWPKVPRHLRTAACTLTRGPVSVCPLCRQGLPVARASTGRSIRREANMQRERRSPREQLLISDELPQAKVQDWSEQLNTDRETTHHCGPLEPTPKQQSVTKSSRSLRTRALPRN